MQTISSDSSPRFFGVQAVRAAFVLALFGWGVGFYGPPIFLAEIVARTQWPLGLVSSAVTVHFLFGALVVTRLPRLHARLGLPVTTMSGAVVTALGVFGWTQAAQPWQLFAAALASGAGWVTMGAVTINAIVARWYDSGRPAALAKAYNGASIGGALFSPLWVALIHGLGFAGAATAVGTAMIAVVILLSRAVFSKTPGSLGQQIDGGAAGARRATAGAVQARMHGPRGPLWRDRAFLTLAAGMALGLFAQIGLFAHLFKILVPILGAQAAGLLMGGSTACAIVGRMAAARAVARLGDRRAVAAANYGMQALGALALFAAQPGQTGLLILGVGLFGLGIGNATSLPPLIAQSDFAARDTARVVALIVAIGQGAYAFAPAVFGFLLQNAAPNGQPDIGHGAGVLFAAALAIQLGAAAAMLAGRAWPPDVKA